MKHFVLLLLTIPLLAGCTSTGKRAAIIGGSAAAGAGAGAAIGGEKNRAGGAIIGGAAGAAIGTLALGKDGEVYSQGLDDGYSLGSADSIKRHYWAKQALEAPDDESGQMSYYVWEEQGVATDGRRLAPERVALPVYEPIPR